VKRTTKAKPTTTTTTTTAPTTIQEITTTTTTAPTTIQEITTTTTTAPTTIQEITTTTTTAPTTIQELTTRPTTPDTTPSTEKWLLDFCHWAADGNYVNPYDCKTFISCSNQITYIRVIIALIISNFKIIFCDYNNYFFCCLCN
jgi:hypothetical protein